MNFKKHLSVSGRAEGPRSQNTNVFNHVMLNEIMKRVTARHYFVTCQLSYEIWKLKYILKSQKYRILQKCYCRMFFSNNSFSTNLNRFSLFEWIRWGPRLPWRPSTRGCSSGPCPWSPTSSFLITTPVIQLWLLVPFRFVDFERSPVLLILLSDTFISFESFRFFPCFFPFLLFFHSLFNGLFYIFSIFCCVYWTSAPGSVF